MKITKPRLAKACGKLGLWTLIFSVSFWSFNHNGWISEALANYVTVDPIATNTFTERAANGAIITYTKVVYATHTHTGTKTGTYTNDGPSTNTNVGSSTDTNCHTGGGQYGGGQYNWCNRKDPNQQRNTQDDTKDLNNSGGDQSTALGMAAIAAGMAMVAAGMALLPNPPTAAMGAALIAAGMALIAAGMAALAAAKKMNDNANKAGNNAGRFDNLNDKFKSTISDGASKSTDGGNASLGDGNSTGIKIDPALTRQGKLDGIFGDLEKKTGLNRDDFVKAMQNGANPLQLLANSPAMAGKPSASEANLQKMMDDTMAKGNLPSGQDVMDKLGLSKDDLVANTGGADVNRSVASSNSTPNIDALFPTSAAEKNGPAGGSDASGFKVSPEVQAALDKRGITSRSLFEMVHSQYVKKTRVMFGVEQKIDGTAANPFANIGSEKVDL